MHHVIEMTICNPCFAIFSQCEKGLPVVPHVVLCERNLTSFFSQETMLEEKPSCYSHNRVHPRVFYIFNKTQKNRVQDRSIKCS